MSPITFKTPGWLTFRTEAALRIEHGGEGNSHSLHIEAAAKTDWWRAAKGSKPESDVNRSSAPVYLFELPPQGSHSDADWTAGVWMAGDFTERFQQATIFVGIGDDLGAPGSQWLKAGYEVEEGHQMIGSVATARYSDWAIQPSPHLIGTGTSDTKAHQLYVQIKRHGPDMILSYALAPAPENTSTSSDGSSGLRPPPAKVTLMREVKGFAADLEDPNAPVKVGVMTCGPLSGSTLAHFHSFQLVYDEQ